MPKTIYLDSEAEIEDLYAGVDEDFRDVEFVPWMHGELDILAEQHREYFDAEQSPDGGAWAPNAPSTIKRKGHSRILRGFSPFRLSKSLKLKSKTSTGDAVRESIEQTDGATLGFGSSVEYAGDRFAGRPTKYAPSGRPHIGINEEYLDKMTERAVDYVVAQLASEVGTVRRKRRQRLGPLDLTGVT